MQNTIESHLADTERTETAVWFPRTPYQATAAVQAHRTTAEMRRGFTAELLAEALTAFVGE